MSPAFLAAQLFIYFYTRDAILQFRFNRKCCGHSISLMAIMPNKIDLMCVCVCGEAILIIKSKGAAATHTSKHSAALLIIT